MSIFKFLGLGNPEQVQQSSAETETVRKIVERLDDLPEDRARYVAAFSYMLARVAHADLDISADETNAMERIVIESGGLPEAQAILVVQMAKALYRIISILQECSLWKRGGVCRHRFIYRIVLKC